jgi:phosphonate transport system substrate-binding protein
MESARQTPPPSTPGAITFAIVSSSPAAQHYLGGLCYELSRALSSRISPRVLSSYAELRQEVEAGRVQVVWAPPRLALDLEDAGLASIDLCCTRGGQAVYHAALFTQHASPIETLADLKGRHAAWVDTDSAAGYLVPRRHLAAQGLDPDTLFGKQSFLGTHSRVACAVLAGEADVGATYLSLDPATGRPLSAGWLDAGAGINGAFILDTSGPIPSDAIAVAIALPAEMKSGLAEQLIALQKAMPEEIARLLGADGFAHPKKEHFDVLRAMSRPAP